MKFVTMPTIHTPRLVLRRVRHTDLRAYHSRLTSDPSVAATMLWEATEDICHTESNIRRICAGYETGERYHWAIALKSDDSLIGTIALLGFDQKSNSAGFAYMLGKDYWNRGYGTEALGAVIDFAFDEMELEEITADHFANNPASGAVMRKVGMKQIGLIPGKYEKTGASIDAIQYSIKKELRQKPWVSAVNRQS